MNRNAESPDVPPLALRLWFYAGGTVPPSYGEWAEAKLSSRREFLFTHFAGSLLLICVIVLPVAALVDGGVDQLPRVALISAVLMLVGSVVFGGRFQAWALRRQRMRR